jgi:hypothetical protein
MEETTNQDSITPPELRNPQGKGGFGDHPENRSDGRWSKTNSIGYWLNYFLRLSKKEFVNYQKEHVDMSMSALSAYSRVSKMIGKLDEFVVVANRTEGMPRQHFDVDTDMTIKGAKEVGDTLQSILDDKQTEVSSTDNSQ